MPLHVDRTTVHPHGQTHAHAQGHVLERQLQRGLATENGLVAASPAAEDAAAVDITRRPSPAAADVQSIEQADALVRAMLARGGAAALAAHGAADPHRVAALVPG